MPNQRYYGDKYNQGDFKDDKDKTKTEGQKLKAEDYIVSGDPITDDNMGPDGRPLQIHKDADPIIQQGIAEDQKRYGKTDQLIREGKLGQAAQEHPDRAQQVADFAGNVVKDAKEWRPWYDLGGNIGALGIRAIDSAIPRTPQELMYELAEFKATNRAYPALKIAKEIPIVKKGLTEIGNISSAVRQRILTRIASEAVDIANGIKKSIFHTKQGQLIDNIDNVPIEDTRQYVRENLQRSFSDRPDRGGLYSEVPVDHDLEFALRQKKPKSIKQITLEDRLNDPRIEKFLTGKGKLQSKELSNLVQEFADREDFMGVVSSRIDQLKEKYPHLIRKLDNQKETIALRWHHVNPSKGPIDLYKGLTDPADRAILRDTLVNEFEVFSGNHPLNNRGLSIDVHDQIHDWLGENVGLRADVLKHKWATAAGVDVGDLAPGTGFMSNHQVLSPQGRDAFDAWFSKLKPQERLPFIREYGGIIKESEGILGDLMQQYDALFAVPEGFRLTPDNDVLLRFLDELPTDGSRLLQQDVKAIVEQVNREMPRGTVNIVNEEGVIKQLNLESDIYKRIIEVKAKLDATKDLRKARSLKNELKTLEAGILQKTLDFSGAQKQGAWKKRLEQEKLRRQGK